MQSQSRILESEPAEFFGFHDLHQYLIKIFKTPEEITKKALIKQKASKILKEFRKNQIQNEAKVRVIDKLPLEEFLKLPTEKNSVFSVEIKRKYMKYKLMRCENLKLINRKSVMRKKQDLWLTLSGAKNAIENHKTYYEKLKKSFHSIIEVFEPTIELPIYHPLLDFVKISINQDLKRTLLYETETISKPVIAKARNVLLAFAKRNPYVGYCQGLNFIIAEILCRSFDEEEAFWFFSEIIECALPIDYYSSMVGILVDQRVFGILVEVNIPELHAKFKEYSLDTSIFTLQWFVCLFVNTLKPDLWMVVWDFLLIEGSNALLKAGYAILELIKHDLLQTTNFGELLLMIEEKTKLLNDPQVFQRKMMNFYMSRSIMKIAKELFRQQIKAEFKNKKFSSQRNRKFETCDLESPLCHEYIEKFKAKRRGVSCFIFRQASPPVLIEDYFEDPVKLQIKLKKTESSKENEQDELLIGRHHHICDLKYVKIKKMNSAFATHTEKKEIEMEEIKRVKEPNIEQQRVIIEDYFKNSVKMPNYIKKNVEIAEKKELTRKKPRPKKNTIEKIFCLPGSQVEASPQSDKNTKQESKPPDPIKKENDILIDLNPQEQTEVDWNKFPDSRNELLFGSMSIPLKEEIFSKFQEEINRSSSISFRKRFFPEEEEEIVGDFLE